MKPQLSDPRWHILLVDDDEDDFILTRALLTDLGGERTVVEWASGYQAALTRALGVEWDALLVDYDLGAHTGIELIRELVAGGCNAPAILLTGRGSYEVDLEASRAGAVDYIAKDQANAPLLERAIRYAIERQQTQRELRRARDELELRVQERTRELELANRSLVDINQHLEVEISERQRVQEALQEREAGLQSFVTQLPAVVWSTDKDLRILSAQGMGLRLLGLSSETMEGGDLRAAASAYPAVLSGMIEAHEAALAGETTSYELEIEGHFIHAYVQPYANMYGERIGCIGMAIDITENRRLQTETEELKSRLLDAAESERLQLAQELHDGPMQELYAMTYALEALRPELTGESGAAILGELKDHLLGVIHSLRGMAGEMRPPALAPYGLERAIRSHAETVERSAPDLQLELHLDEDGQTLSERKRLALYRIYQVALNNIVRHAGATQVLVRLKLEAEQVRLEVRDNGRGFRVPTRWIELARQGHMGLVGAFERTEALGGQFSVTSQPGQGTQICVVLPRADEPATPPLPAAAPAAPPLG
jgi:PAS domain S-box-containing protein